MTAKVLNDKSVNALEKELEEAVSHLKELRFKISVGGRLNGADIARTETVSQGKIPLHNLRSDIDFASVMARTIWGAIGVKVWINRGEVFEKK